MKVWTTLNTSSTLYRGQHTKKERLWKDGKLWLEHVRRPTTLTQSHLDELCWRHNNADHQKLLLGACLEAVKDHYTSSIVWIILMMISWTIKNYHSPTKSTGRVLKNSTQLSNYLDYYMDYTVPWILDSKYFTIIAIKNWARYLQIFCDPSSWRTWSRW